MSAPPAAVRAPLPTRAEWKEVTRGRYGVRQAYRYSYTGPVSDLRQRLVMLPPERHGDQRLCEGTLRVRGAETVATRYETDRFGNRVCHVLAAAVPEAVEFTAEFTVERTLAAEPPRLGAGAPLGAYLAPTALTAPDARIQAAAREIAAGSAAAPQREPTVPDDPALDDPALDARARRQWALARRAGEWTAGAIAYQFGVTGVQTPAAMALHLGRGVCQDYAHIALALLRALDVPARYVSGHLLGEGAPHAWVEALLPDPAAPGRLRAVPYDPTHSATPGLNYITVAVGRDYADVAPTSGSFSGPAAGRLAASKDAWVVELDGGEA